jgi:hypothetical protein
MIVNTTISRSAEPRFREQGVAREGEIGIGVGQFAYCSSYKHHHFLSPNPLELCGFRVFDVSRGTEPHH